MKRFVQEDGADLVRAVWESDVPLVTSWASFVETSAAIGAARRSRRLSRRAATAAARELESDWECITPIAVVEHLAVQGGALAVRHRLRSLDAIHLATALLLRPVEPLVVTFDERLAEAARWEGLAVVGTG